MKLPKRMARPGMEWKANPGAKPPLSSEMRAEAEDGEKV